MPYLVFAMIVAVVVASAGLVVRRQRRGEPSRSIESFHRRLEALEQVQADKDGRRR